MSIKEHCLSVASRGYIGDLTIDVEIRKLCDWMAGTFQLAVDLDAFDESLVFAMETWAELFGMLKFAVDAIREAVPDEYKCIIPYCPTINEMLAASGRG